MTNFTTTNEEAKNLMGLCRTTRTCIPYVDDLLMRCESAIGVLLVENDNLAEIADRSMKMAGEAFDATRKAAMAAILDGLQSDGSNSELILRRAWERVLVMRIPL